MQQPSAHYFRQELDKLEQEHEDLKRLYEQAQIDISTLYRTNHNLKNDRDRWRQKYRELQQYYKDNVIQVFRRVD